MMRILVLSPELVRLLIRFVYTHDYWAPPAIQNAAQLDDGGETKAMHTGSDSSEAFRDVPSGTQTMITQPAPSASPVAASELIGLTEIAMHAKMYALGAKYDINSLKAAAQTKLKGVKSAWSGPSFARTIRLVFSTTVKDDDGLLAIVVETIQSHRRQLQQDPDIEWTIMGIES